MTQQKHFLHVFSTFTPAGPELRAAGLMVGLGKDYRHTVISCDGRTETADLIRDKVDLTLLPLTAKSGPLGHARALREVLAEQKPDLLLSYNWGAMDASFAARMAGFKHHLHHEDGFNADEAETLKGRRNWARRLTLKGSEIVVPSRRLLKIAGENWHLPKVTLIPNGVHVERFAPKIEQRDALRAQFGIPEEAFVVGTVAHLRPVKRLDRMVRACAQVSEAALAGRPLYLMLVGDGVEKQALEALAQQHMPPGGKVVFTGHLPDPAPAYSAMDALALSSASEQQPVSVLEAMAASLPIVSTDVGDVRHTVSEEAVSLLVDPTLSDDLVESGLAKSLSTILADPDLRESLAKASLRQVKEKYSFEAMFHAYMQVFERAMA
ncbi:MAG: glycosyltransferase [Planctomycetota bacterium]|nr:glycosyltransferase [Planctomycetota bacterium]